MCIVTNVVYGTAQNSMGYDSKYKSTLNEQDSTSFPPKLQSVFVNGAFATMGCTQFTIANWC